MSQAPKPLSANPGQVKEFSLALTRGDKQWTEQINVVALLAEVLQKRAYAVTTRPGWLELSESGYVLLLQLVDLQFPEDGGARIVTTIQVHHPEAVPEGMFEYQHATADDTAQGITQGFDQWAQVDLVALLEVLRPRPAVCTTLEFSFPAKDGKPRYWRRAILGPVMHYMAKPPAKPTLGKGDEHPYCPCCLLTRSYQAFAEQIKSDRFCAVRMFAMRDQNGITNADCRVNGEDCHAGMDALKLYAATWAAAGYEFRKQYVIVHNFEGSSEAEGAEAT